MKLRFLAAITLFFGALVACEKDDTPVVDYSATLEEKAISFLEDNSSVPGISISIVGNDKILTHYSAVGEAAPDKRPFTAKTPVRLASTTKTFVAATLLRLWEQDKIDLDAPLSTVIDTFYNDLLLSDGYDISVITTRHLLQHTSGIPDHARDAYIARIFENPQHQWTRQEQMKFGVDNFDPLGGVDEQFQYSDTGFVLLGHIIERITGKSLAASVRDELNFEKLGLKNIWWEQVEEKSSDTLPRAHQFLSGQDTHDWNASMDLYGGGGLVASTEDMALFMAALMRGQVFESPKTLEMMMKAPGHPFPDNYRLGLFPDKFGEVTAYSHGGFWGTNAMFIPELDIAIAGAVLEQEGYRPMFDLMGEIVEELAAE